MLFGRNNVTNPGQSVLFADFPIGTRLQIGMDSGYWLGHLADIQNNLVILNNARFYSHSGSLIEELRSKAQFPISLINFVSEAPEDISTKPLNIEMVTNNIKKYHKQVLNKVSKARSNLDKSADKFADSVLRVNKSAQRFFNNVLGSNSSNLLQNDENGRNCKP